MIMIGLILAGAGLIIGLYWDWRSTMNKLQRNHQAELQQAYTQGWHEGYGQGYWQAKNEMTRTH